MEAESGSQRLGRHHPLPAQQELVREFPERQMQRHGGSGDHCRTAERPAKGARQIAVGHGGRRRGVERTRHPRLGDGVQDQTHAIVQRDPRHPLPARPHRSAQAEFERGQQAGQHAARGSQNQADAQGDQPDAQGLDRRGRLFPGVAQPMAEAGLGRARFVERPVGVQAIPADGGAADQHLRPVVKSGDEATDVAGDIQAGAKDAAALSEGPQPVADRLARQVDDGVDAGVGRDPGQIGHHRDRRGQVRGFRIADQGDHLVPGACQGGDQPAADETGGPGDKHAAAPCQGAAHGGRIGLDQAVGASSGREVTQAEDEDSGRGGAGHQGPQTVGGRRET
ncbi:MAG: hypothetical protein Q8Q71_03855 [Brevundimonas sp.]|nr:hypothetical protein [Brevundimonas sp.]MDP3801297.1 hypothetical protein [Brevundimonas sp.]